MDERKESVSPQLAELATEGSKDKQKVALPTRLSRRELLFLATKVAAAAPIIVPIAEQEAKKQLYRSFATWVKRGFSALATRTAHAAPPIDGDSYTPELDANKFPLYGDSITRPQDPHSQGKQLKMAQFYSGEIWPSSALTFKDKCILEIHPLESGLDWVRMSKGATVDWVLVTFGDRPITQQELNVYTAQTLRRSQDLSEFHNHFFGLEITNRVHVLKAPKSYTAYPEGADGADALFADMRPLIRPLAVNSDTYPGFGLIPIVDNNPDHYDKFGWWGRNLGKDGGECLISQDVVSEGELGKTIGSHYVLVHEASHALLGKGDDYSSEDNIMNGNTLFNGHLKYATERNIERICTDPVPRQNIPLVVNQVQQASQ